MIVEWKHICPQKSLIFPAVMNQLGGTWWLSEHQEPELERKEMYKVRARFRRAEAFAVHGSSAQAPEGPITTG